MKRPIHQVVEGVFHAPHGFSGRDKGQPERLEVGVLHGQGEHLAIDRLELFPAPAKLTEQLRFLAVFPRRGSSSRRAFSTFCAAWMDCSAKACDASSVSAMTALFSASAEASRSRPMV